MRVKLIFLFSLFTFQIWAQNTEIGKCATDYLESEIRNNNPELDQKFQELDAFNRELAQTTDQSQKTSAVILTVPVVVHVMYADETDNITMDQIIDAIDVINIDFRRQNADTILTRSIFQSVAADMEIEFKLARLDPSGNCTDGVNRVQTNQAIDANDNVKPLSHWDNKKYLNIWVVRNILLPNQPSGTVLGYAYRPSPGQSYKRDGVVIRHDMMGRIGTATGIGRTLTHEVGHQGHGLQTSDLNRGAIVERDGEMYDLNHGDVVIAAITSCTNTSNPDVMLAAGLIARKARLLGLDVKPWVKTSLAPGSRVVTEYYEATGLDEDLNALGFHNVGYGCTTCIGNSGPLPEEIEAAIDEEDLIVGSVISGNRNFEGRVHGKVKASYLASPPLVVAYAIAGSLEIDLTNEPLGISKDGVPVMLSDIWPSDEEIAEARSVITPEMFKQRYSDAMNEPRWDSIPSEASPLYPWEDASTYIRLPSFFQDLSPEADPIQPIQSAKVLLKLGDSITTDHISPAGAFPAEGPAGRWLTDRGVEQGDFNSFGSRRGNHEIMMRGTFANVRIRNQMAPGTEGGFALDHVSGEISSVYEAAMNSNAPMVVLAGSQYGTGSSRDWAAKGTYLLGVKAVIATSFERIHRSNLVGMGVLPLTFVEGESHETLGLDGTEMFSIPVTDDVQPLQSLTVTANHPDGSSKQFEVSVRLDTPVEVEYYRNGGILHTVLRQLAS